MQFVQHFIGVEGVGFSEEPRVDDGALGVAAQVGVFRHRAAHQAVAGLQVVVEETEGRAQGEAVQPEAQLGQLHGHGVEIHAEEAPLHDEAFEQAQIVQVGQDALQGFVGEALVHQGIGDGFALLFQGAENGMLGQPGRQGRIFLMPGQGEHQTVGQVIQRGHQEVAGAHGGVEHFQIQQQVEDLRFVPGPDLLLFHLLGEAVASSCKGGGPRLKRLVGGLEPGGHDGRQRVGDQPGHQAFVGVVAGGGAPHQAVLGNGEAIPREVEPVFEQAFIQRSELPHAQIAKIHAAALALQHHAAEGIQGGQQLGIGHFELRKQRVALGIEEAAVVVGQAHAGIAAMDEIE